MFLHVQSSSVKNDCGDEFIKLDAIDSISSMHFDDVEHPYYMLVMKLRNGDLVKESHDFEPFLRARLQYILGLLNFPNANHSAMTFKIEIRSNYIGEVDPDVNLHDLTKEMLK